MRSGTGSRALLPLAALLLLALVGGLAPRLGGCQGDAPEVAVAKQIATRTELIGGPSALGEVGDFLLENDKIRVIIQGPGFSRGFGVYGGSLIDADLVRALPEGRQGGGEGRDQFGEMFPIFFLEALVPEAVVVHSDGASGGPARVRVSGTGGDFLTLTKALNQAVLNSHRIDNILDVTEPDKLNGAPQLTFSSDYELSPGDRHVVVKTTMVNITDAPLPIPSDNANFLLQTLLGISGGIDVPLGHVLLFGAGNEAFAPGFGYDVRFSLDESYANGAGLPFPALPGLITPGVITSSDNGVSYGFFVAGDTPNFAQERKRCPGGAAECDPAALVNAYEDVYGDVEVSNTDVLVPFLASAFTGVFYAQAPRSLAPGEAFTFTSYFVVGDGDVSSVMDELYRLRGAEVVTVEGLVRDPISLDPVEGASVIFYDAKGRPNNQMFTRAGGRFQGALPPGDWSARVQLEPGVSEPIFFSLQPGQGRFLELASPAAATVKVRVRDELGRDLPAKVTIVGSIDPAQAGRETRKFLFDLAAGQELRASDFIPDNPNDPETLQYIEAAGYTQGGVATLEVRPGIPYTVYVSRGIEYDLQAVNVRPLAGRVEEVHAVLTKVIDTTGYVSGDFHLHAAPSLDSSLSLDRRVISCAGEGLELAVSTDHNFITDYRPTIERLGLQDWMQSMVGLEMTTLESGHFNGFPVRRDLSQITRGAFEWSLRTPDDVFKDLRALGPMGPDNMVIQVNHARDSVLGYFSQYDIDPLTLEVPAPRRASGLDFGAIASPNGPAFKRYKTEDGQPCDPEADGNDCKLRSTFSFDFDALEVFNGKRVDQIRHFRVPASLEGYTIPEEVRPMIPPAGTILCDEDGGTVAWPGHVDDWFGLLNRDQRVTGLGNSDSHGDHLEEPAYPRTYVAAGTDDPARIDGLAVVRAIQEHRAIVTNGPFVELFVNDQPIGAKLRDADGQVSVRVVVQAAPWIDVDRLHLIVNGDTVETVSVLLQNNRFEHSATLLLDKDSWIVAEVEGDGSMFPVIAPLEVPPVQITDAVGALAGPLGFGGSEVGDLMPSMTRVVTPYAITNPIWVDQGDAGFVAPGIPASVCEGFGVRRLGEGESKPDTGPLLDKNGRPLEMTRRLGRLQGFRRSMWFPRQQGDMHDVRVIFDHFSGHNHVH
jgi:hypothetical protein